MMVTATSTAQSQPKLENFYRCSCHSEGAVVSFWEDDDDFTFTILRHPGKNVPGLADRIKAIWNIVWRKRIEWDDLILDHGTAVRMARDILRAR